MPHTASLYGLLTNPRRGAWHGSGLGKARRVVERTLATSFAGDSLTIHCVDNSKYMVCAKRETVRLTTVSKE
jgi:hypothetical protein